MSEEAPSLPGVVSGITQQNFDALNGRLGVAEVNLNGGEAFLKLLIAGNFKVTWGTSSATFAATTQATKAISHGLGVIPIFTIPVMNLESGAFLMASNRAGSATKTEATFQFNSPTSSSVTGTFSFGWLAIG